MGGPALAGHYRSGWRDRHRHQRGRVHRLCGAAHNSQPLLAELHRGALLTIANPSSRNFIEDCWVHFDLAKATTGFAATHSGSKTITFGVGRKVDGTNYRVDHNTQGDRISSAIAEDAGALLGCSIHVGPIGPDEDCVIYVKLSAEEADCAIPYVVYYRGPAPTITEVAAA
ncbi:MAG: hypothetical protein AMJ38_00530 [Dehalococcoidia bacterium DG_22]|nr:MAG: hypothetical protein AMJ38_00530 [Dehalococcoidia bacterium DG_22]